VVRDELAVHPLAGRIGAELGGVLVEGGTAAYQAAR
jgi:hypothetical protein